MRRLRWPVWAEYGLSLTVATALAAVVYHVLDAGYLPQPFFYEPNDTFMDWFNTKFWAHNPGTYDAWQSIYPPLSFLILAPLGNPSCYVGTEGLTSRDCDWFGIVILHAIFALNIILTARIFIKIDRRTAAPRAFALAAGLPMLFALERGNLILLTYTFILLAFGPLLASARLRWIFLALAINLKVYLVTVLAALLLKRKWYWVEGAGLTTIGIYLLSFGIFGRGTPPEIYNNVVNFTGGFQAGGVLDTWLAGSYQPLISLLQGEFPVTGVIGSQTVEMGLIFLTGAIRAAQLAIAVACFATWLRPEAVPTSRLVFFGISFAVISVESGGYGYMLPILFVFMERWRGVALPIAIVMAYVLCIPWDIIIGDLPPVIRESYLAGRQVYTTYGVGLGPFVRPGLMIIMAIAMAAATIRDVWVDIREQGWKGRWRFRHDHPLLPWVERPQRKPRG
jgi:hypothetical protein